uniref:MYND-type domain-containing protein n=1 Tax=Chromera velia CCMP2878 TaxID=1169474 RepID=A0A0G4HC46_9ALVE|eukprot:Cvel_26121.t1-p1 / transcript=Cvel_26121.t1 / gene=Cvel_26121 / organism=Chromera_velia_CCMP2878 / gene_product=Serine/threonine-protein phosphatase 6 regulatory, putative / transcript_product=Serine/threonine-protein phosphatase 6 regulatory, putative / location=Cvel_scaffold3057:1327-3465(+) / protein_length=465 / sequence_SO=supercontig / SO=protein_coding / is_pseudo=false
MPAESGEDWGDLGSLEDGRRCGGGWRRGALDKDREFTPFHGACLSGSAKNVNLMVQNGHGRVIKEMTEQKNRRFPPLHLAVDSGNAEFVQKIAATSLQSVNVLNSNQRTALMNAVMNKTSRIVEVLTQHKQCDTNIQDPKGNTALHFACSIDPPNPKIVKLLLTAKIPADPKICNAAGWTALHCAAESNASDSIADLIRQGIDPTPFVTPPVPIPSDDQDGASAPLSFIPPCPLPHNSPRLRVPVMPAPVDEEEEEGDEDEKNSEDQTDDKDSENEKKKWDLYQVIPQGISPLHISASAGHLLATQALCQNGTDAIAGTEAGCTPIMLAARAGDRAVAVLQFLLAWPGVSESVNSSDLCGNTAVHYAAESRNHPGVLTLLDVGAHAHLRNKRMYTPLDLARGSQLSVSLPPDVDSTVECIPVLKRCGACGATNAEVICFRCNSQRYCSAACQKQAWAMHKSYCRA